MMGHIHSYLSKAKGIGPSHCGTNTWVAQRLSALALIPLTCWFVTFLINAFSAKEMDQFMSIFTSPFPTVLLTLFISVGIYHGSHGMIEIIEDYVHCSFSKLTLIVLIKFISILSVALGVCSILVLHLSTFVFN